MSLSTAPEARASADRALQQRLRARLVADRLGAGRGPDDPARLVELVGVGDHLLHERQADRRLALVELADADEHVGEEAALRVLAPRQLGRSVAGLDRARRVARPAGRLARLEQHLQRLARVDRRDVGGARHQDVAGVEERAAAELYLAPEVLDVGPQPPVGDQRIGSTEQHRTRARADRRARRTSPPRASGGPWRSASRLSSAARSSPAAAEAWPLRRRARSAASSSAAAISSSGPTAAAARCHARWSRPTSSSSDVGEREVCGPALRRTTGPGDRRSHERMAHLDARPGHRDEPGALGGPQCVGADARRLGGAQHRPEPPAVLRRDEREHLLRRPRAAGARARGTPARRSASAEGSAAARAPASCAADSAFGSSTSASALPPAARPADRGPPARRAPPAPRGDQRRRGIGSRPCSSSSGSPGASKRCSPLARREQHHDALGVEPARDEQQRVGGGGVEPLGVVDHAQHRPLLGELGSSVRHGDRDQEAVVAAPLGKPERPSSAAPGAPASVGRCSAGRRS